MAQPPPEPRRTQSSTSLHKLYNGPNGGTNGQVGQVELQDPGLNYCNAFWGQGDRGYDVVLARLRGAGRTVDELKAFWKERAAIEEDYAKRLSKLSRTSLGRDEVGDLADSLKHLLAETAQQAAYHSSLGGEIKQTVENPSAELGVRMSNLKKGLQTAIEKSHKNKGLQEGHVQKARERYEQDCLRLNSYTAQSSLTQGKELEKLHQKLDRVRYTIPQNEQEFRQFVKVLEATYGRWEQEWKNFCDHVQDLEEERMAITKDLMWTYANAVSQVCVEDDSSCERIREKLEQFEPMSDIINFVKGWGTGDIIPDPPRFINYSAGEAYPTQSTYHVAHFTRLSSKTPMSTTPHPDLEEEIPEAAPEPQVQEEPQAEASPALTNSGVNGISDGLTRTTLKDEPAMTSPVPTPEAETKIAFGGIALPGMASSNEDHSKSMPPPPMPPASLTMPEPRIPSRQGPPSPLGNVKDEEDPMAKALADLRREPPPPGSVRRAQSHIRRPDSVVSAAGSARGSVYGQGIKSPSSPAPQRMSFLHNGAGQSRSPPIEHGLSPPPGGHTASALAQAMDQFRYQSSRGPEGNRHSVNYTNFAEDIVGAHPVSRPVTPVSPSAASRAPSPAMMQPPQQPQTHIADQVLSQYHQAFPGERERSRSRAGSIMSNRSRSSFIEQQPQHAPPSPSPLQPRQGFVGIGTGNAARSPSPQPPASFRSPSPSPVMPPHSLGPQNMGISLDAKGGVAQDTMAEQYRRQYQQQQQQHQQQQQAVQQSPAPLAPAPSMTSYPGQRSSQQYGVSGGESSPAHPAVHPGYNGGYDRRSSTYGQQPSPIAGPPAISGNRPASGYGGQHQQSPAQQYGQPHGSGQYASPGLQQAHSTANAPFNGYAPSQQAQTQASPQPDYAQRPTSGYQQAAAAFARGPSPQPQSSPQPQQPQLQQQGYQQGGQNQYARSASTAPQTYGYQAPQQPQQPVHQGYQQQQQPQQRTPSPQPNQPPAALAPTGQWSTTGLPIMFYVKALYDYKAETAAEFDFQAGDIIAVTSTPEDGWWSGELLDEARRRPGRTDFPSNFVTLF